MSNTNPEDGKYGVFNNLSIPLVCGIFLTSEEALNTSDLVVCRSF
jgi:hypothetical protein